MRGRILALLLASAVFLGACASMGEKPETRLSAGEHSALINCTRLYYHVHGSGPVVIVQPGGPGFSWNYLRMPELEKLMTVVYLEPVGSGQSERLSDVTSYSIKRFVKDIEGFRKHLGLEKFYLLGHSHGGMVAQVYALDYPKNLKGLLLATTTPVGGKEIMEDIGANLAWFKNESWFAEGIEAFKHVATLRTDDEEKNAYKKVIGFYVADYLGKKEKIDEMLNGLTFSVKPFNAYLAESTTFDIRSRLSSITAPTLIVAGRKDAIMSVKFSEMIRDKIVGSRMAVMEHSGHLVYMEEPVAFAKIVGEFLAEIEKK